MNKESNQAAFEYYLRFYDHKNGGGRLNEKSIRQYLFDIAKISDCLNDEGAINFDLFTTTDPGVPHDLREDLLGAKFKLSELNIIHHHSFSAALTHYERYLREDVHMLITEMRQKQFVPLEFAKERAIQTVQELSAELRDRDKMVSLIDGEAPDEKDLLAMYRKLSESNKQFVFKVISALSKN